MVQNDLKVDCFRQRDASCLEQLTACMNITPADTNIAKRQHDDFQFVSYSCVYGPQDKYVYVAHETLS